MRGDGGPAGPGGERGTGLLGSAKATVTLRWRMRKGAGSGGQSLLGLCCLEGGSFMVGLGMLSFVSIPRYRLWDDGVWLCVL